MKKTRINPISKKQRRRKLKWNDLVAYLIKNRAYGRCEVCGELPDWRGLSGHHIIPKSKGGKDTPENCLITCGRCHAVDKHHLREADVAKDILQTSIEQKFILKRDGWGGVRRNRVGQCQFCDFVDITGVCTLGVLPKAKCDWFRKGGEIDGS